MRIIYATTGEIYDGLYGNYAIFPLRLLNPPCEFHCRFETVGRINVERVTMHGKFYANPLIYDVSP